MTLVAHLGSVGLPEKFTLLEVWGFTQILTPIFEEPANFRKPPIFEEPLPSSIVDLENRRTPHLQSSIFELEDLRTPHLRSSIPKNGSKIGRKTGGSTSSKMGNGILRRWEEFLRSSGAEERITSPFSIFEAERTNNILDFARFRLRRRRTTHLRLLVAPLDRSQPAPLSYPKIWNPSPIVKMFPDMPCMKRVYRNN